MSAGGWYSATDTQTDGGGTGTLEVIATAVNFYINMNLPLTMEMYAYMQWWIGVTAQEPEEFVLTKEGPIHLFTFEQQIDFGRGLIEHLSQKQI